MEAHDAIEQIETDFSEQNEPFDDIEFPEERLLEEAADAAYVSDKTADFSHEEKLRLISMFATFDYNRDANQLVDNVVEVFENNPHYIRPHQVDDEEELTECFEDVGFRYPSRDAAAWVKNCRILREKYHASWSEMLLESGLDAPTLVEGLEKDDFNCLKGVKIAPMYARIVSNEVAELDRLWELDIPIDTHVRTLSKKLFGDDEMSDDEIRDQWYVYGVQYGIDRHVVDGALWQIGNNWDQWGEDYWESLP
jgi:endonuclease III